MAKSVFPRVCIEKKVSVRRSLCDCVKMSKVQMLRESVKQRLTAAAEEIFGLFETTIAEYEEERCRSKEENERQRELLDAVFTPKLRLHRTDVQQLSVREEEVPPEQWEWSPSLDQQHPEPPHIKEEQEELWISQEREQLQELEEADITTLPFTPVPVKSEDDEEKPQPSQLHQRQYCGGPEPAKNSDPDIDLHINIEDQTGDSSEPETDDSNEWKETREARPGLNSLEKKAVPACDSRCSKPACQKPFSCSECGKRFGRKSHLKGHMMIHTGEKPFSCSVCGKRFGRKTHLKGHMHAHTGHKPFSCSVCKKYFARNDYLQSHMTTHTGEKRFSCSVCKKSFAQSSSLKSHMRRHTGERPFSCRVCDQRFTWLYQLRNHQHVCCQSSQLHQRQTEQMETEADDKTGDSSEPETVRHSLSCDIEMQSEARVEIWLTVTGTFLGSRLGTVSTSALYFLLHKRRDQRSGSNDSVRNWIVLQPIRPTIRVTYFAERRENSRQETCQQTLVCSVDQRFAEAAMASSDFCRLCKTNMRVSGMYSHSSDLFAKLKKPLSIVERLKGIGLAVVRETGKSDRVCNRCVTIISHLEHDLPHYRRWEEENGGATSSSTGSTCADEREREPTPTKTPGDVNKVCPNPLSPGGATRPASRRSRTEVIINYPSRKVSKVCEPEDGLIINHINKKNWKGAAKRIVAHKELLEHLKPCILQLIQRECTLLCSPKEGFMLWRSSPGDLACFSFSALEADLHRLSPFLLSVFNTVTNHSRLTTCAAAAIAIRGRQSHLSAFSHYLNIILSYGGSKKAVFNRLSKMSITTSHKCAIGKQKELANTCATRQLQLKQQNERFLHIGTEAGVTQTQPEDTTDTEMAPNIFSSLEDLQFSDVQQLSVREEEVPPEQQEWSPSLDQQHPEPPHIKEEQEELWISQEREQLQGLEEADITKFPFTPVPVKSEDDEEKPQLSQLHQRQTEQMETETDGEDCGGPEPAKNSDPDRHPEPKTDDKTGDSSEPETDDSNEWKETREARPGLNSLEKKAVPACDSRCSKPACQKPFSCSECGRRFGCKSHLKGHMMIHTGERPFSCSVCNSSFAQSWGLKSHMLTHTGGNRFSCSVCKKSFGYRATLQQHMRRHTGEKRFSCSVCDQRFTWLYQLRNHHRVRCCE
ncbi:uncharacterized protein LOC120575276 [Perca fluviatilis]|uniref:uncharacterized protein LOC120575276 n=1 Tax=Perca fluviatilis TaxID=8168 RepID=UPI00196576B1|nr:uncharacterized protein LOC120575276 [Perca fluviatilis]